MEIHADQIQKGVEIYEDFLDEGFPSVLARKMLSLKLIKLYGESVGRTLACIVLQ